eukprot:490332-Hanusia_phi.AAC.1
MSADQPDCSEPAGKQVREHSGISLHAHNYHFARLLREQHPVQSQPGKQAIADEVCDLYQLTELDVSNNNLSLLPGNPPIISSTLKATCMKKLLQWVERGTDCQCFLAGHVCSPDNMEKLTNLKSLDIRGNLISVLPSGLGLLSSNLKMLNEGSDALLKYLQICHTTLKTKCLDLAGDF